MFGRALFAFVWLIIAAGLVLPMYPPAVETARSPAMDSMLQTADSASSGCQDCPITDEGPANCRSDCSCGHMLSVAYLVVDPSFAPGIRVIVLPRPIGLPSEVQPLPPKLPTI
jgi:hypothetical protein